MGGEIGEGIGEVVALSDEEREYVQKQTTNSWLDMTEEAKDELVVLIGRWLEESSGYIVPDYDDLVAEADICEEFIKKIDSMLSIRRR